MNLVFIVFVILVSFVFIRYVLKHEDNDGEKNIFASVVRVDDIHISYALFREVFFFWSPSLRVKSDILTSKISERYSLAMVFLT